MRPLRFAVLLLSAVAFLCALVPFAALAGQELEAPLAALHPAAWWAAFLPVAWIVLTGVVNTIAHYETPTDVDAWAERQPRLARFLSILRRCGLEPVALIQDVYGFFAGNPPPFGLGTAMGKPEVRYQRARPASSSGFVEVRALAFVALCLCAGCAAALNAVPPVTALGLCVFDYVEQHPGLTLLEYVARSAVACGGDELTILDQLLASQSPAVRPLQAEARALKAAGGAKLQMFAAAAHARAGAIRASAP